MHSRFVQALRPQSSNHNPIVPLRCVRQGCKEGSSSKSEAGVISESDLYCQKLTVRSGGRKAVEKRQ
jgi:hypothetical protein